MNIEQIQQKYNIDEDMMSELIAQYGNGASPDEIISTYGYDETTILTPSDIYELYADMDESDEIKDIVDATAENYEYVSSLDKDNFRESTRKVEKRKTIKEGGFLSDDDSEFDWDDVDMTPSKGDFNDHETSNAIELTKDEQDAGESTMNGTKVMVMVPNTAQVKVGQVLTVDYTHGGHVIYTQGRKQYAIPTENVKPLVQESNIRKDARQQEKIITKQYIKSINEGRDHDVVCQALSEKYNITQEDVEYTLSETLDEEGNELYFNMATRKSSQPIPFHRAIASSDLEDGSVPYKNSYMKYSPQGDIDPSPSYDYESEDQEEEEYIAQSAYRYYPKYKPSIMREEDEMGEEGNNDAELEEIADDVLVQLIKDSSYRNAYDTIEDAVYAVIAIMDLEEKLGDEGALTVAEIIKQKYETTNSPSDNYEVDGYDLGIEGDESDYTPSETATEFEVDKRIVESVKKYMGHPRHWTKTERHFIASFYDKPVSQSTINEMKSSNSRFDKIKEEGDYVLLYFKR